MKTQNVKSEALLELVFKNRNKAYGAYEIRRHYHARLNRATALSIMSLLLAFAYPLIASYYYQERLLRDKTIIEAELISMAPPPLEVPPPPPPPTEALENKTKFKTPIIVNDSVDDSNALNIDDLLSKVKNPNPGDHEFGKDSVVIPVVIETHTEPTEVFTVVEEMPFYSGGDEARLGFLRENLHYPQLARESRIEGTVYVTFVVDAHGKVTDIRLARGIGGGCDEEAMRVIGMMTGWNAGRQAGKAVKVSFTIPVKFNLG